MFSNLSQNSILYVLETKDKPRLTSGTIISVTVPRPQYATFGQNVDMVMDITATIDGERREFKKVPCSNTIANFGADAFILADSKDSISSYISATLQNSKNIVNSIDKHKKLIKDYEELMSDLNPYLKADKEKDKAIQTLQEQVNALQDSMKQMLSLMTNEKTTKS